MQSLIILVILASVLCDNTPTQAFIEGVKNLKKAISLYNSPEHGLNIKPNYLSALEEGDECVNTILRMANNITSNELLKNLYSSSGKSFNQLGDYRVCIDDGHRYVLLTFFVLRLGLCIPIECADKHLAVVNEFLVEITKDLLPDNILIGTATRLVDVKAEYDKPIPLGTYIVLSVFAFIFLISIGTAAVDYLISKEQWNSRSRKVLESFNIVKNGQNFFCSENKVDKNLDVLNGVKVLFMGWIMQGHLVMDIMTTAPSNAIFTFIEKALGKRSYSFYFAATFAVDIFFWLTGFLAILVMTEQLKKRKKNIIPAVLLIYLHRYLRMLPIYIVAYVVPVYILPYLYEGANYVTAKGINDSCEGILHYNFLYLNNFIEKANACMGWTWYIACDFQIYLLVPWLVLLYRWRKSIGYIVVSSLIALSVIIQFQQLSYYGINADVLDGEGQKYQLTKYYIMPYCRVNPFLIGVLMAWIYLSYKQAKRAPEGEEEACKKSLINRLNYSIVHNWILRYSMYIIGFVITTVCTYTYYDFYEYDTNKPNIEHHFYLIFSRPGFVIGIGCIIYPACLGRGKVIREALSLDIFNVISKAIYAVYMMHMPILIVYWSIREEFSDFTKYSFWNTSIDSFVLSCLVAIVATLVFEYPIIGISKEFLRPKRAQIINGKETETKVT
jgi:peptidoglycan/LPS O-acetylase OafA/YrhL